MLESYSLVKELQMQVKNMNERMELLRQEITFNKKEAFEDDNKLIAK